MSMVEIIGVGVDIVGWVVVTFLLMTFILAIMTGSWRRFRRRMRRMTDRIEWIIRKVWRAGRSIVRPRQNKYVSYYEKRW